MKFTKPYDGEKNDNILKLLYNKWVALVLWVLGCGYITFYGFLKDPIKFTASMIGLDYPRLFCLWGIFSIFALFTNINYMYRKYEKKSLPAFICTILGSVCILMTVAIPSTEIMSLQLVAHWSGALLFGVFYAAAIAFFLWDMRKEHVSYLVTFIAFILMLALMIALLIAFNKNGLIESIPMWGAYIILFFLNFTPLYPHKKAENAAEIAEPADVEAEATVPAEAAAAEAEEAAEIAEAAEPVAVAENAQADDSKAE